ncbi:MAG: hypothetical protein U5L75_02965 [Candidatus Campbellbacteria bacterium]|nr:hypothetical protein [Candidatus Campbellbacteria bacterium]
MYIREESQGRFFDIVSRHISVPVLEPLVQSLGFPGLVLVGVFLVLVRMYAPLNMTFFKAVLAVVVSTTAYMIAWSIVLILSLSLLPFLITSVAGSVGAFLLLLAIKPFIPLTSRAVTHLTFFGGALGLLGSIAYGSHVDMAISAHCRHLMAEFLSF